MPTLRGLGGDDGFFRDCFALDQKGARAGFACLQADDDVVPVGVRGLGHIGLAGVGLRMGVAVRTPENLKPLSFGGQFCAQVLFRVDGVDESTVGNVGTRNKANHLGGSRLPYQQAAHLLWIASDGVLTHGDNCVIRDNKAQCMRLRHRDAG